MDFISLGIGLIVLGYYLYLVTNEHAYFIDQEYGVDHKIAVLKRSCLFVLFGCWTAYTGGLWFGLVCVGLAAGLWWVAFDLRLNGLRDLDPLYVGKNAEIDKYFRRLIDNTWVSKIFKDVRYLMLTAKIMSILVSVGALIGYGLATYGQPDLGDINVLMTCLLIH